MPGTSASVSSAIPVMPTPASMVTAAVVRMLFGGLPPAVRTPESCIE